MYTPEQLDDTAFIRTIPETDKETIYDKNDRVLFGSNTTKGKVMYKYIPADKMSTGRPMIIGTEIAYDGKGNSDLPPDAKLMNFSELPQMFPDNKFH